jgi:multiple sugar transport system permease protein
LDVLVAVVLVIGAIATAFPFFWMISSAVKPRSESLAYPPSLLPETFTFEHVAQLFTQLDYTKYLGNTVAVVLIGFIGLLLMAMAGYALAKFEFKGKKLMFFVVLVTMMVPVQVTMIPTYLILNGMKLTNTLLGIALPTLVSGFSIFLFRQFMLTIPTDMLEAARLDGAGETRIFVQIVLPLAKPILAVQAILTFIAGDQNLYTLSVGLALLNDQVSTNPSLQMAASSLMVVPILIVFIIFQRHIVQGFSLSGLK